MLFIWQQRQMHILILSCLNKKQRNCYWIKPVLYLGNCKRKIAITITFMRRWPLCPRLCLFKPAIVPGSSAGLLFNLYLRALTPNNFRLTCAKFFSQPPCTRGIDFFIKKNISPEQKRDLRDLFWPIFCQQLVKPSANHPVLKWQTKASIRLSQIRLADPILGALVVAWPKRTNYSIESFREALQWISNSFGRRRVRLKKKQLHKNMKL